jgi:hypothetical protein
VDKKIIQSILIAILFFLLIGFSITGWQAKYIADDFCYDAQFIQHGFWEGNVDSYLSRMAYSSNRYSLTFFSGIAWALGGVRISPLLPTLAILFWGGATFFAIHMGAKAARYKLSLLTSICIALILLFFTFLLAPNRYQILYWRSGMVPYLFPLVFNTFLIGLLFFYVHKQKINAGGMIALGLIAWTAAGFSETVFALQAGLWVLVFLYSLVSRKKNARKAALAILVGTLLGLLLLVLNPTNADRLSAFPAPPPLFEVVGLSLIYAGSFAFDFIRSTPLPFFILLVSGILLGWMELGNTGFQWKRAIIFLSSTLVGTYILLACVMAPTIWSMSSFPERRGLLSGAFLIILFLFSLGAVMGIMIHQLLDKRIPFRWKPVIHILLAVGIGAYLIHFIPTIYDEIIPMRRRAELWDARNAAILDAKAAGQMNITVAGIDSIAGITELQKDGKFWINQCAATYYGVESIQSIE